MENVSILGVKQHRSTVLFIQQFLIQLSNFSFPLSLSLISLLTCHPCDAHLITMIMNQLVGPSGSSVGGGGDVGSCFAVVASVQHDKARRGKSLKVFVGG